MSEVEIKNVKPLLQQNVCYVQPFFETASFHIVKPCNMKCKFCYATFEDMHIVNQLSKYDAFKILDKLKEAGLQKITFAGGEPLLYKWIYEVIVYSKGIGLTTSIQTVRCLLMNCLKNLKAN
jgi:radical S-adenosyl methionine domain-containing protein 2